MVSRSRLQNDERRTQLLELGLRLFSERSYEDVSIGDIAGEAGVSKGLLYHYFGGKRAFYMATVRLAADRLLEAITPDPELDPASRARAGLEAYLDFVEHRAQAYAALMHGGLGADAEALAIIEEVRRGVVARALAGLGIEAPRPIFRLALRGWVGAVEAASLLWLEEGAPSREAVVDLLMVSLQAHVFGAFRIAGVTPTVAPLEEG